MTQRANHEGSIRKRKDGRLEVRMVDANGKRRSVYPRSLTEAKRVLRDYQDKVDKGIPVHIKSQTVGDFLQGWISGIKPLVRPRTWVRYEQMVRIHLMPTLGKILLTKLTPATIQALYSAELNRGASPRTVLKLHSVLHHSLDQAAKWDLVPRNVADLVEIPKPARREMKTFSVQDARALLSAAAGDRLEALYVLALTTGMRQGELLGLHWRDIDLEAGTLMVRGSLGRTHDGLVISAPKNNRARRIELTKAATVALRCHRSAQATERLVLGASWDDQDLIFPNALGRPMDARNLLRRSYAPLLRRAGVPSLNFHALRHTAATLMLMKGIHPKVVSEMLGHSQISITLDTYSHVLPTMQRQATALMDELLTA